jgi:hypothetical protein
MLHFAREFSQTLRSLRMLDDIGVKTASAEAAQMAEEGVIRGSNALYGVLLKTAAEKTPYQDHQTQVVGLVRKMAAHLGKPDPSPLTRVKIASAIVIDDLLTSFLNTEPEAEHLKLAETRSYGREFVMDLLRTVL